MHMKRFILKFVENWHRHRCSTGRDTGSRGVRGFLRESHWPKGVVWLKFRELSKLFCECMYCQRKFCTCAQKYTLDTHTQKVPSWNSRNKCDLWHCLFSRDCFVKLFCRALVKHTPSWCLNETLVVFLFMCVMDRGWSMRYFLKMFWGKEKWVQLSIARVFFYIQK